MSNIITQYNSYKAPTDGRHLIHTREGLTGCMFGRSNIFEGVESANGVVYLKGILQRADSRNQNGRVYPYNILKREAAKYDETFIAENRAYGELDHPSSAVIELKTASHTVNKLWWQGKELWGIIELLNTPNGNIVKNIVKQGKNVGISSRGLGSYRELDGDTVEIEEDFELIGWDIVSNPSTQRSFVYPTSLNEGVSADIAKITTVLDKCYNSVERSITDIISTY